MENKVSQQVNNKCIEVEPIHIFGLDCFESLLISVANYFNREFELTFSEAYGFDYSSENSSTASLGERISAENKNIRVLLDKYCGIQVNFTELEELTDIICIIRKQLEKGLPIGIRMNAYWCPWHSTAYQINNTVHYCLVIDIDKDNNLTCIDPLLGPTNRFNFPYNDFIKGVNLYFTFEVNENPSSCFDYAEILKKSINRIIDLNVIDKMNLFVDDFYEYFDFEKEFKDASNNMWGALLQRTLAQIATARDIYLRFIKYISEKTQTNYLSELLTNLGYVHTRWKSGRNVLFKAYYAGFTQETKDRAFKFFKDAVASEIKLMDEFKRVASLYTNKLEGTSYIAENETNESEDINQQTVSEYICINLKEHFNKIAFTNSILEECLADFSETGACYFMEEEVSGKRIEKNTLRFDFPVISDGVFDNISCIGQSINVPEGVYNTIMILGASEWGSYTDAARLSFIADEQADINISFSDWTSLKQEYDDICFMQGKAYDKKEKKFLQRSANIFAIQRKIPKREVLKSITLPNCPNIHIFAITLCK